MVGPELFGRDSALAGDLEAVPPICPGIPLAEDVLYLALEVVDVQAGRNPVDAPVDLEGTGYGVCRAGAERTLVIDGGQLVAWVDGLSNGETLDIGVEGLAGRGGMASSRTYAYFWAFR